MRDMGSHAAANGQQKAQKGWLSRWTRKQWSRHWFVLKNGSLTYYRGPAAELCSFLDGVLDLSLIKHIEVPQQEEKPQQQQHGNHHHHSSYHNSNSIHVFNHHPLQHQQAGGPNNQNHQVAHQNPNQNHHQQQQQQELHFSFTLKMWNGECHLLSASSSAERQLWLAAINSCNNFDDETASSDSSSSSQSSNISTKSTDVGCSPSSAVVAPPSVQTGGPVAQTGLGKLARSAADKSQQQTNNNNNNQPQTGGCAYQPGKLAGGQISSSNNLGPRQFYQNALQAQQQQEKEAEISLEHLALKLKSVVRKRRDESPPDVAPQPAQLLTRSSLPSHKLGLASSAAAKLKVESGSSGLSPTSLGEQPGEASKLAGGAPAVAGQEQAHKRRLMCLRTDSADDLRAPATSGATPNDEQLESGSESESESESEQGAGSDLNGRPGEAMRVSDDEQAAEEEEEEEPPRGEAGAGASAPQVVENQRTATPPAEPPANPNEPPARQKKRVTFDLSNQIALDSLSASSLSSESTDEDEEATTTTLSSATSSSSSSSSSEASEAEEEDDDDDEEEEEEEDEEGPEAAADGQAATSQTQASSTTTCASAKQRLEPLREQLKYAKQREMDEDEDSTCELVRRMIERRKLRLQNKEGAAGGSSPVGCEPSDMGERASSATSTTEMETNEADEHPERELHEENRELVVVVEGRASAQVDELEMRLRSAEFNSELLERRLNESYVSYSQLEVSYKQLQLELIKCQEVQAASRAQMQMKIDELTGELKASELRLLEAKEKLLKYEEHLAKWQLINASNHLSCNKSKSSQVLTASLCREQSNEQQENRRRHHHNHHESWLTKNYSNCLSAMSAKHTKLEAHQRHQAHQQVSSSCSGAAPPTSGGGNTRPPLILMQHNLKQTLAMNQQQLSLKLLNQSKQIQRKLNELELKVDKIQQAGDCNSSAACPSSG